MVPSATDAWTNALDRLRNEIPSRTVENWLVPISVVSLTESGNGTRLVLEVPTAFNAQYLQSRFNNALQQAVTRAVGQKTEIEFRVTQGGSQDTESNDDGPANASTTSDQGPNQEHSRETAPSKRSDTAARPVAQPGDSGDVARAAAHAGSTPGSEQESVQAPSKTSVDKRSRPSRPTDPDEATPSGPSPDSSYPRKRSADESSPRPPAHRKVNRPTNRRTARRKNGTSHGSGGHGSEGHGHGGAAGNGMSQTVSTPPSHLKAAYTFDEFIEGDGNRLARSAAMAVAESPGETNYNPLLIYGGVGLGKTHLAQAIANHALKNQTTESVLYVSSDRFTSQFVRSVKNNSIADFSAYYRQADLLIVDDVQFFGGKEKTQEEFFHIFNDLHQHGRQIVLCADRPPSEIDGIEERLLSRFQWGLSADIQRPDLETRIAILQRKASRRNIDIDPRVVELLAHRIDTNIRKLEGALNRLAALAQLDNQTVSMQAARRLLHDQIDDGATTRVECGSIMEAVAEYYRLSVDDLLSRSRKREIASARQTAMYLCREMTNESYASIGSRFGGRDHSTVIHAHKKVSDRKDVEAAYRRELEDLKRQIGGPGFE